MALELFIPYIIVFLYGIVIGSFLNVCLYRLPKGESVVTVGSHCMQCNHRLKWRDLIPLFSWLALKGKCRYCGARVSVQYPIVEAVNGGLYILVFAVNGWNVDSVLWCLLASALLVIAVMDYRTMLIPGYMDAVIFGIGVVHLGLHWDNWTYYVIGFFSVSLFLLLCALLFRGITGKSGLGLGDVELMACAGLCIGWGHALLALVVASVSGSVIQGITMAVTKRGGKFALGPYLAAGIFAAALWGDTFLQWYLHLLIR